MAAAGAGRGPTGQAASVDSRRGGFYGVLFPTSWDDVGSGGGRSFRLGPTSPSPENQCQQIEAQTKRLRQHKAKTKLSGDAHRWVIALRMVRSEHVISSCCGAGRQGLFCEPGDGAPPLNRRHG